MIVKLYQLIAQYDKTQMQLIQLEELIQDKKNLLDKLIGEYNGLNQ